MKRRVRTAYDADGRRKYLTRDEGKKFLRSITELPPERTLFCLVIFYTGCRISEALNLTRLSVDSELCVIMIRSLKKRDREETRRVPVPEFISKGLMELGEKDDSERLWNFSRTTAWRIVKSVMQTAGLSGIHATSKGLRHAFGVRGAMEQIPINIIQNWLGHSDIATTAIYLGVRDEEERELIERTWK